MSGRPASAAQGGGDGGAAWPGLRGQAARPPPRVKPSSICGPFRTLNTMYEAGKVWAGRLEQAGPGVSWLPWLHRSLVENTFPVYLVSALLL